VSIKLGFSLREIEDRELSRIFGSKREKVTGGWRKLHNEALHNVYSSQNNARVRWAENVAHMGKM
jgi:hypothetical protein